MMAYNFQTRPRALIPLVPENSQTFNTATLQFLEEQRANLNHSIQDEYCTDANGNWDYRLAEIYGRVERIERIMKEPAAENSPIFNRSIRQQILCIHDDLQSMRKLPFGGLRTVFPHLIPDFGSKMLLDSDEPLKWYRVPAPDPDTQFLLDRLAKEVAFPESANVQVPQNSGTGIKFASSPKNSIYSASQMADNFISQYDVATFSNPSAGVDTYSSKREYANSSPHFANRDTSSLIPVDRTATVLTHKFNNLIDQTTPKQKSPYHRRDQYLSRCQSEERVYPKWNFE